MLLALGLELPEKVYGHGWLTISGGKISKSKGNYKDPREFIKDYGVDTVRYYLLSEVPFGSDGNFSEELMVERRNSDLCNVLGNLVNRTITMANKYCNGKLTRNDCPSDLDKEVISFLNSMINDVDEKMDSLDIPKSLSAIFSRIERLNKYIDETSPWLLAKDANNMSRLNDVLYTIVEGIRMCSLQLEAFIPSTSKKIYEQLNIEDVSFDNYAFGSIEEYQVTAKPEILFARIDEQQLKEKLKADEEIKVEHKEEIDFKDFDKVEMVVGKVIECHKHPDADKILVFKVDFGYEQRQILSGVAQYYQPEQLLNKKVIAVMNLKPRKIRGLESQGMLLSAVKNIDGKETIELLSSEMEVGAVVC